MISANEKKERTVLRISLWANAAFALIEIVMSIITMSQAVLMDAAVDTVELAVVAASLVMTPLFYRPITEKRPYGYFQVESLFIIVKGFMLFAVAVSLIVSNIGVMLSGGRDIDSATVSVYEVSLGVLSLGVYIAMGRFNKKLYSPTVKAEMLSWKTDFIISFALGAAFMIPPLIASTRFAPLSRYLDQAVAIALSLCIIPRPARMIVGAFKSLLLFPPKDEKREFIDEKVAKVLREAGYAHVFTDVTQTGRKLWLGVTFSYEGGALATKNLRALYARLHGELEGRFEGIDIELIPLWNGYERDPH